MKITLEVANNKAEFIIELLRNLDFVKVTKASDWYDDLNDSDKRSIKAGLTDLSARRIHEHESVMYEARKKLAKKK